MMLSNQRGVFLMLTMLTTEQKTVYKDYRTAKTHLKAGRDFADWMKIARGYDQARREAMHQAGTNAPQGPAYREEFAEIDRREKLIDRDASGKEFPSREDRTYCIKVIENYDMPSYDPRRVSIKAWRDSLPHSERAKLNHPKRVWEAYWARTEPQEEKEAKAAERERKGPKENPFQELVAVAEGERDDARRGEQGLRELLGRILEEVNLPDDLREAIKQALAQ
jgi:hypothetical protein